MCSSSNYNRVLTLLSYLYFLLCSSYLPYCKMKEDLFLQNRAPRALPSISPTLINLHSITLNGCLVRIRSISQPYNHLRQFSNFEKQEGCVSLLPLNAHFDVLAGWHVAGLEQCSCIKFHCNLF